mgnify:CR=1 FL=1|jgi:hypothetical protein|tara:strand:- start:159 stop:608 length:450 start_codon:yes stop_codon:yes gene_type:complete
MISLIGSLLGFASGVVPEIVGYFRKQQDHEFELELYAAKAKYAEALTANKLKELDLKAEIQELKSLYKHDQTLKTDNSFISALRASVRPVITYFFFFTFVGVELSVIFNLVEPALIDKIWSDNTAGLFAAVLSFWFGSRAMSKVMRKDK